MGHKWGNLPTGSQLGERARCLMVGVTWVTTTEQDSSQACHRLHTGTVPNTSISQVFHSFISSPHVLSFSQGPGAEWAPRTPLGVPTKGSHPAMGEQHSPRKPLGRHTDV